MTYGQRVQFNPLTAVAFGSITASYAAFGAELPKPAHLIRLNNSTNQDVVISADGTTDHLRIASNSFVLLDFASNRVSDNAYFVAQGTQFYIKYVAAPSSGSAWIEVITAAGGV